MSKSNDAPKEALIMDKAQMLTRISLLSDEMDANDEENKQMQSEIDTLYAKIDAAKMTKPEDRLQLAEVARRYNTALESGKVKQKRDAASEAHQSVLQAIKKIQAAHPVDADLLRDANALFLDVRMGRPSSFPV